MRASSLTAPLDVSVERDFQPLRLALRGFKGSNLALRALHLRKHLCACYRSISCRLLPSLNNVPYKSLRGQRAVAPFLLQPRA